MLRDVGRAERALRPIRLVGLVQASMGRLGDAGKRSDGRSRQPTVSGRRLARSRGLEERRVSWRPEVTANARWPALHPFACLSLIADHVGACRFIHPIRISLLNRIPAAQCNRRQVPATGQLVSLPWAALPLGIIRRCKVTFLSSANTSCLARPLVVKVHRQRASEAHRAGGRVERTHHRQQAHAGGRRLAH